MCSCTRLVGLAAVPFLLVACGNAALPVQPTPQPAAGALPPFSLEGSVTDSANRPLPGARVEVVDGPRTGTAAATDDRGHFSMPGTFTGPITVLASMEGHASEARTVPPRLPLAVPVQPGGQWSVAFQLEPIGPSANVAGIYSLTVTADSACGALPNDARTRTYTATVAPFDRSTYFIATLSGAQFFATVPCPLGRLAETCTYNHVGIGVAGDFSSINVGIIERLGESAYLLVSGGAEGTFAQAGISVPLSGELQYCTSEPHLIDQGTWACPSGAGTSCDSRDHHLTLRRR